MRHSAAHTDPEPYRDAFTRPWRLAHAQPVTITITVTVTVIDVDADLDADLDTQPAATGARCGRWLTRATTTRLSVHRLR